MRKPSVYGSLLLSTVWCTTAQGHQTAGAGLVSGNARDSGSPRLNDGQQGVSSGTQVQQQAVGNSWGSQNQSAYGASTAAPPCTDREAIGGQGSGASADGRDVLPCIPSQSQKSGAVIGGEPTLEQVSYDQATLSVSEALVDAQSGAGRVDSRMDALDLALRSPQIFTDLRTLQDQIVVGDRPITNAVGRYSSQSDHLDISQEELSQDIFFSEGRSQLRLGVQNIRYQPDQGYGIRQRAAGFTGTYRINDIAAVSAEYWFNWVKSDQTTVHPSTYDVFLTLWPSDFIRIDIDTNGRTFDNVRSAQLDIVARTVGGSIDYMPSNRLRLTARVRGGFYTDGNARQAVEAEVVWRAASRPRLDLGVLATGFHYDQLLNNGYFNPRSYKSVEAMARLQSDLGKRLTVELAGSAGAEDAHPGGTKPIVKASLQARYKVYKNWSLDGAVAHFSSRTSTSSGFSRTSFTAGLHLRF